MPTIRVEYTPEEVITTTPVPETFPSTTIVCTVTSHHMPDLKVQKGKSIMIPAIGFSSPSGGNAQFVRVVIIAIPSVTDGVLKVGDATLGANSNISLNSNGLIRFDANADTFDGTTFTYKVVTTCGESAVMTGTISVISPTEVPCNCN